jgi:hypothetical protein
LADETVSPFAAFIAFWTPFSTGLLGWMYDDIIQVNVRTRDNQVHGTKTIQEMLDEFKNEVAAYR